MWLRFAYLVGKKGLAGKHAEVISALGVELDSVDYNNMGYLRLAQGRLLEARELFDAGIAKTDRRESVFGLLLYNRGVTRALDGDRVGALEDLRGSSHWVAGRLKKEDTTASCLFALRDGEERFSAEEITDKPEIQILALEGIRLLKAGLYS